MVPETPMSGEVLLRGLQTPIFSLDPHMVEQREDASSPVSVLIRELIPSEARPSWPHHLPKAASPNTIILGLWFQHMSLSGDTAFSPWTNE